MADGRARLEEELRKLRNDLAFLVDDAHCGGPDHEHEIESIRIELRKLDEELRRTNASHY